MNLHKISDVALKVACGLFLALSLVLTFTVSDYYIFNRFTEFGFFFCLSQWVKKSGLLLLPLAVFYNKKSCSDAAKYVLPLLVIVSMCTFGNFFDISMLASATSEADKVYASINEFIPKWANMALFFAASALELLCCALLVLRDGCKVKAKSFICLPFAILAVMPLNIFENFYNPDDFTPEHFLWFKNFTVWHLSAILLLATATIGAYFFLKNKDGGKQRDYLAAAAIVLLIQYHSKDSLVMGDGYNVYHTVFACMPLFICNIGVYVASLSVILRKKVLYAISFFVHAAGALTVFFYFGRDDMSNYGIIFGHTILYFCLTHYILFMLSVLPSALGHYKFKPKDCIIPLIYYCLVIVTAAVASGIVTSASMSFSYDGYTLSESEWLRPNYAFTQINPLPIPVFEIPITIWKCQFNLLYLIILYAVYVGLFWTFTGAYYLFLFARKKVFERPITAVYPALEEAATTLDEHHENK